MNYITETTDIFKTYSFLLEEGIPSVLDLVKPARHSAFISIPGDKSVTVSRSLGDKVIDCLEHQEKLQTLFTVVSSILDGLEAPFKTLLVEYYCEHKCLSTALKDAGFSDSAALDYARGLFAYNHPDISFSESEFRDLCITLKNAKDSKVQIEISIRDRFSDFKKAVLASPSEYSDLVNRLEQADPDHDNSDYLQNVPSGNVKFFRKRTQILLAAFYEQNPDSDYDVILSLNKEGQCPKKYIQRLHNTLHPEVL